MLVYLKGFGCAGADRAALIRAMKIVNETIAEDVLAATLERLELLLQVERYATVAWRVTPLGIERVEGSDQ